MDHMKILTKLTEAQKFCELYRNRARSIDCDRQSLAEDLKTKKYYLEILESYTQMVSDVDERITQRQQRITRNTEFLADHEKKYKTNHNLLEDETSKLILKAQKLADKIEAEKKDDMHG